MMQDVLWWTTLTVDSWQRLVNVTQSPSDLTSDLYRKYWGFGPGVEWQAKSWQQTQCEDCVFKRAAGMLENGCAHRRGDGLLETATVPEWRSHHCYCCLDSAGNLVSQTSSVSFSTKKTEAAFIWLRELCQTWGWKRLNFKKYLSNMTSNERVTNKTKHDKLTSSENGALHLDEEKHVTITDSKHTLTCKRNSCKLLFLLMLLILVCVLQVAFLNRKTFEILLVVWHVPCTLSRHWI